MAETDNGGLFFTIGLDDKELKADAQKTISTLGDIGDKAVAEGARIDNALNKATMGKGSVLAFQQFSSQIARIPIESMQLKLSSHQGEYEKTLNELNEILSLTQDYYTKRLAIQKNFQKQRDELTKIGAPKEKLSEINSQEQLTLTKIDNEFATQENSFKAWMDSITNLSLKNLQKLLFSAEQELKIVDFLAKQTGTEGSEATQKKIAKLQTEIAILDKKREGETASQEKKESDSKDTAQKWKTTYDAVKSVNTELQSIGKNVGGATGEIISTAVQLSTSTLSMIDNITKLSTFSGTSIAGVSGAAGTAIKTVEKASVILAIVGAAFQIITQIVNVAKKLFSSDGAKEDRIKALAEENKEVEKSVKNLEKQYTKLGKEINKAYSTDASKLIGESNQLLEQENEQKNKQKAIIDQQIKEEESKKKPDKNKIKAWNDSLGEIDKAIADNNAKIEENKEKQLDAFFGKDVKSAINDFAQAYASAWTSGEDKAKAMKDVVKKMIKGVIVEMLKANLQPTVKLIREKIEAALVDGIIDATEQAELDRIIDQATKDAENKNSGLDKYMVDEEANVRSEATQKGFASMSQESANELNGRFTTLQTLTFSVNENTKILVANSGQILLHLAGIESNTKYCENLAEINSNIRSVKSGIDDMNMKGITIKK